MVEVLVAGAGPAGSAAALVLARAGVRVLLVDRARFPRPKLCGETINPGTLALLDRLGLRDEVESLGRRLDGMLVTGAKGVQVRARYPRCHGLAITRARLDHVLLQAAARAGAQVQEQVRVLGPVVEGSGADLTVRGVTLETKGGRIRLPAVWTVGAEGRRPTLALSLGLVAHPRSPRRWAVGGYYAGVEGLSSFGEMHIRRGYYVGISPVPGGLANTCVVTADRHRLRPPFDLLARTTAHDPWLRERFASAQLQGPIMCLGPLALDARTCGVRGLLLAGDAAGFIDPMTGDGLRFAIHGGILAAEAILRAFDEPTTPAHLWLAAQRQRVFRRKQQFNRVVRLAAGSEAGVTLGELGARFAPAALRRLVYIAGDVAHAAQRSVGAA